ncbi:MAG: hypothetical protein AB8B51_18585 [Sedimentitalea sp.]
MTALSEYERLEATGLWRPASQEQRREVVVSIGDATLTIADFNNTALTHWSLAAIDRANPGEHPAIFSPDGDPSETLELAEDESEMIIAIERLRQAVDRARPRPGRLRLLGVMASLAAAAALAVFWLPGAATQHTLKVVPQIKRQEIGAALLGRIERVAGQTCASGDADAVLVSLATRLGVRKIAVLRAGVAETILLPGNVVLLNKALIEDHEDPSVAAGYIVAEQTRAQARDPMGRLLDHAGPMAAFKLLTTGDITQDMLDSYAERVLIAPRENIPDADLLDAFAKADVPSSPYAYARDITGETVLGLIEADPMAGRTPNPVLRDRDWVILQNICGG